MSDETKTPSAYGCMSESTRLFHEALIRACKGIIKAWETWLSQQ